MSSARPIYDRKAQGRPLRVAAFMSGSGSNVVKLLESQGDDYQVVFIFSDRQDETCRGQEIARRWGLPYFSHDIRRFHELRGLPRSVADPAGLKARREFDQVAARLIRAFEVDLIALGGYMSFLTLEGAVNVHPADLSLTDSQGRRLFVGDRAVHDAIAAGQKELRSSTLWIDQGVDSGPLLMVSDPLAVELPVPLEDLLQDPARFDQVAREHQERLKEVGDWVVFPLTLKLIAQGRLGLTPEGTATLDGVPVPGGIRPAQLR